jgi:hypothetical protein
MVQRTFLKINRKNVFVATYFLILINKIILKLNIAPANA